MLWQKSVRKERKPDREGDSSKEECVFARMQCELIHTGISGTWMLPLSTFHVEAGGMAFCSPSSVAQHQSVIGYRLLRWASVGEKEEKDYKTIQPQMLTQVDSRTVLKRRIQLCTNSSLPSCQFRWRGVASWWGRRAPAPSPGSGVDHQWCLLR